MTVTFSDSVSALAGMLADDRALAQVLVIVTLVALLLQREMLGQFPQLWAKAGHRGLTAIAVPLFIAWVVITSQRVIELIVA